MDQQTNIGFQASRRLRVTIWSDYTSAARNEHDWTLAELAAYLRQQPSGQKKLTGPMISLARFGDTRSSRNSLRHGANLIELHGVECDSDDGAWTAEQAADALRQHGLAGILYESWSHTPEHPRWRALIPFASPKPPADRRRYVEILNGLLGGHLAPESVAIGTAFFFRRPPGQRRRVVLVDGDPLDVACLLRDLEPHRLPLLGGGGAGGGAATGPCGASTEELVAGVRRGESVHPSLLVLIGRWAMAGCDEEEIRRFVDELIPDIEATRGAERVGVLLDRELDDMIEGALTYAAERRDVELEGAFLGLEEDGREGGEEEEDLAEAPVEPQLARLRRLQAGERLEAADRSLEERTLVYDSVLEALTDPAVNTVHAATGSGKTWGLAAAVAVSALLREGGPPVIIVCGTALYNIDNFVKEIAALLLERFLPKYREAGYDDETAEEMAKQEIKPLLERCARVQRNRKLNPLRNRDGTYNYALILCTYGAIHRIGAAIDARGRLLRLLAGMRRLEEKHGLLSEPILVYGDEADAGLAGSAITLPLQHRRTRVVDGGTGKGRYETVPRCKSHCLGCELVSETYAAEVTLKGVKQLVIEPWIRRVESHAELTLDWLPRVIGPKLAEEGNYEIFGIRVEELPAIDPVVKETAEDGTEWTRIDPEGQIVRWMRQPGATLRRLLPKDRRSGRLLHPHEIEEGADIQWPTFPCEAWHLVSWDREAFSDLATLCMSTPKLLSASFSIGTLAMVDHAFGPQQHGWVPTPDARKMRHVHLSATADTLFFGQEMAEALVAHSHVLWVEQTEKKAKKFYEEACAWTSTRVKPTLYSGGAYSQIEVFTHNFIITHARSSLARGANLGHCRTVVIHADYYGALLNELGLGHEDLRVALEEGNRAHLVQASGRIMREQTEQAGALDDRKRFVLLRSTTDRDGFLNEDGRFLIPKMQALAYEVTYSQFAVHPRRVLEAQREFFTTGQVTRDDALDRGVTADKLTPRQRRMTQEERAAAKEAARKKRAEDRLRAMAADGVSWIKARRASHVDRTHTKEEIHVLMEIFRTK